ncbi:putative transcriptional regulator [compost metagenome]
MANGYTNRQIASQLQLSERTVKYYMTQIMQKLKARNRVEVVISARQREQGTTGHGVSVGTLDVN